MAGLLTDRVAVVTGGGRGIGAGITQRLLAAGARVLIAQRRPPSENLGAECDVTHVTADLAERDAPRRIAAAAREYFGGADILVNNAGFMVESDLDALKQEDWDRMLAVNLRAPVFLAQALRPQMRRRGGGSIINIGSVEGLAANPQHAAYCASKAGLHGLTRALAVDLGGDNIRCNTIAPGWIRSELSDGYIGTRTRPEGAWEALLRMHPLGRVGEPGQVGDAVVFLASEQAAFVTGQTLVVDGGRTARLPLPF